MSAFSQKYKFQIDDDTITLTPTKSLWVKAFAPLGVMVLISAGTYVAAVIEERRSDKHLVDIHDKTHPSQQS